ncbi:hypothetical protein [uncultured Streptomyces sp.]|uniref:hypothetical protein n=1 Tax=uncultured Streptomyces sp. TaxID=174707 RepID=UPI002603561E|nr:hypothetical protein [uncultured Streptomyces sp.]
MKVTVPPKNVASLNARLKMLETAAGSEIFNHRTCPVAATPRGQALLDEVHRVFDLLDQQLPHRAEVAPALA